MWWTASRPVPGGGSHRAEGEEAVPYRLHGVGSLPDWYQVSRRSQTRTIASYESLQASYQGTVRQQRD